MRIMLDTNVILTALLDQKKKVNELIDLINLDHTMLLPMCVVEELHRIIKKHFPGKLHILDELLEAADYELVYSAKEKNDESTIIRCARNENADFLITRDAAEEKYTTRDLKILTLDHFIEQFL